MDIFREGKRHIARILTSMKMDGYKSRRRPMKFRWFLLGIIFI